MLGHKYTSRTTAFREKFTDYYRTCWKPIPWDLSQGCVPWMSLRYKSRDFTLLTKFRLVKAMVFPVVMYGCESWTIQKTECWRIDDFELWCWTCPLESLLDCKEIKPVNPKGNQSWIFIGRTDAEAKTPILWPPDAKNWLIWNDPDAGWERLGAGEDEMAGWCHHLDGHEFEQALGVGDEQGSLMCYSPWGHKELDTTERLNKSELKWCIKWITNENPLYSTGNSTRCSVVT